MAKDVQKLPVSCSFCGKSQKEVNKLISGNDVYICSECVELCHSVLLEEPPPRTKLTELTPDKIKRYLDERIIGQEHAKMVLSVSIYNHVKRINNPVIDGVRIDKSNVLFIGPTGCGKTYIVQQIANMLEVPMVTVDATSITESGYVGLDVEEAIARLYQAADQDISRTERGIVYIDEIDKKSRKGESASITRDVSGEGVQQGLLKLIEGCDVKVPPMGGRKNPHGEFIMVNTNNILFILGGAFVGLKEIIEKRLDQGGGIGFGAKLTQLEDDRLDTLEIIKQVRHEDLTKYGIIPELIGRIPITVPFSDLSEDDLTRILTEPRNAIVKQFQKMFQLDGVELEIQPNALREIARDAIQRKTGARGLRSTLEQVLLNCQFDLPRMHSMGISKVTVTEETIKEGRDPLLVYKAQPEAANE